MEVRSAAEAVVVVVVVAAGATEVADAAVLLLLLYLLLLLLLHGRAEALEGDCASHHRSRVAAVVQKVAGRDFLQRKEQFFI